MIAPLTAGLSLTTPLANEVTKLDWVCLSQGLNSARGLLPDHGLEGSDDFSGFHEQWDMDLNYGERDSLGLREPFTVNSQEPRDGACRRSPGQGIIGFFLLADSALPNRRLPESNPPCF